jgi:hypothetical protein
VVQEGFVEAGRGLETGRGSWGAGRVNEIE